MFENDLTFLETMNRRKKEDTGKRCDGTCDCVVPCSSCTGSHNADFHRILQEEHRVANSMDD